MNIGNTIKISIAAILSTAAHFLGGWDTALQTLLLFMAIDYLSGWIVAAVFQNSPKTETGSLQSLVGSKGLFKKCGILLAVLIAARLDMMIGTGELVRNTTIIGFSLNELVSILENIGLMGVKYPPILMQAIDILKKKSEEVKLP